MRPVMIFKFGVTFIVFVAIVIFYVLHNEEPTNKNESFEAEHNILKEKTLNNNDTPKTKYKDNEAESKTKNKIQGEPLTNDHHKMPSENKTGSIRSENKNQVKQNNDKKPENKVINYLLPVFSSTSNRSVSGIHLSLVACVDRKDESLVVLKSAILFARKKLIFHIFAESHLQSGFVDQFTLWPDDVRKKFEYFIYDISYPEDGYKWKTLFKPCASQRLFIPSMLQDIDSILYVDTDVLFLSPIDEVWDHFRYFNSTQLASLTPEHEDAAAGWYNRFARHPYYGKLGLNSGVMLMNLTRLRASTWLMSMMDYKKEYALKITWGDQDLINIYFHYHPEELYLVPCEWNYRPDHCMYMSVCHSAEKSGALVLHGCRRVFLNDKQPAFKAVYDAFKEHPFDADLEFSLLSFLKKNVESTSSSACGKYPHIFTKQVEKHVKILKNSRKRNNNNNSDEDIQLEPKEKKNIPLPPSSR